MSLTLAAGKASTPIKLPTGRKRSFAGTLTGTATLTPQLSFDNQVTWVGIDENGSVAEYTATFGAKMIEAPDEATVYFRVKNTAGAGSWAVDGVPGPAV